MRCPKFTEKTLVGPHEQAADESQHCRQAGNAKEVYMPPRWEPPAGQRSSIVSDLSPSADTTAAVDSPIFVSPQRVNAEAAESAVRQFQDVIESQPNVTQAMIAQRDTSEMAGSIKQAFQSFADSGAQGEGQSFSSWLNSSDSNPEARAYLDGMQATFQDLTSAGLNSAEVGRSRLFVANRILGNNNDASLTPQGLANAMAPPK